MSRENMLDQQLAKLRDSALDVDSRDIRYNLLKRDVDTNRQFYDAMLQRYKKISAAGNIRPSNIAIIHEAQIPTSRYGPSLSRNLGLGLLLGAFFGIGLAVSLEFLDDTLKTSDDVATHLGIGILGIIPRVAKRSLPEALNDPRSAFSESYRSVRTALQYSTPEGIPKSLLVTSAESGEGKTISAVALARTISQLGKRILLIDADLRQPTVGEILHLHAEAGLSGLLTGSVTLPAAITNTDDEHLDVILSGPLPPNPSELLSGSKLVSLLTIASTTYDHVIIDSPPVAGLADTPILADASAGTLFVVKATSTRVKSCLASLKRLQTTHSHLIGGVLNCYDARASGYPYGYNSYYGYGGDARIDHDN